MNGGSYSTSFTAEQARDYGLIDSVISSHELSRTATGFGARNGAA